MSLPCAVRGVGLVEISIVTHRLQAARIGRKLLHVKFTNAKGKAAVIIIMIMIIIIIQEWRG